MNILRTTPPPRDPALVAFFDLESAVAPLEKGGVNGLSPKYAAQVVRAMDTLAADWSRGIRLWCWVHELPVLLSTVTASQSKPDAALVAELAAARKRIAELETNISATIINLQHALKP